LPKGAGHLKPNKVLWVVETPAAGVSAVQPAFTDEHDHNRARCDPSIDHIDKVLAGTNGVDIDKDEVSAEVRSKGVVKPTGIAGRIVSPVADKNAAHK
jgi:hypothetical protein